MNKLYESIRQNSKNIYLSLIVFGIILVISIAGFAAYFNYVFQDFYSDNVIASHKQISNNVASLEYQLQQAGLKILDDMDTAFLLYFVETDNVESRANAMKNMQYYKYCYDINAIQIVDLNKDLVWPDENMLPVKLEDYARQEKSFTEYVRFFDSGNQFLRTENRDELTYIFTDYRGYIMLFHLSESNYASKFLTKDEKNNLNTWVYYKNEPMLSNDDEKANILLDEKLREKLAEADDERPFFDYQNMMYIYTAGRNYHCISAVSYRNVLYNALRTASFIWVMALIILFFCMVALLFIVRKFRALSRQHVENMSVMRRESETQAGGMALYKLLARQKMNREDAAALERVFADKARAYFVPVIIMPDGAEENFVRDLNDVSVYLYEIRGIAENVFSELGFALASEAFENNTLLLVTLDRPEDIQKALGKMNEMIKSKYEFTLSYVIGSSHSTIEDCLAHIPEDLRLMNLHFIMGDDRVIDHSMLERMDSKADYPLELQRELIQAVNSQNDEKVDVVLNDFSNYILENGLNIAEEWILTLFINVMRRVNTKENQFITFREVKALTQSENLEQSLSVLREYLLNSGGREGGENRNQFMMQIQKYTEENYSDPNYDLNFIADKLGVTAVYAGKKFKINFHKTFTQYLTEHRMKAAMNYLRNTNHRIADIAALCGFNSSAYFVTSFKKYTSMTPKEYREKARYNEL